MVKRDNPFLNRWGLYTNAQKLKYEKFALKYIKYNNMERAYKEVYPKSKHPRHYGWVLLQHPYVTYFINKKNKEYEYKEDKKVMANREFIIKELEAILEKTKDREQYNNAIKALDNLAKIVGAYAPQQQEIDHKGITINYVKPEDKDNNKLLE